MTSTSGSPTTFAQESMSPPPRAAVLGIGAITPLGRDLATITQSLTRAHEHLAAGRNPHEDFPCAWAETSPHSASPVNAAETFGGETSEGASGGEGNFQEKLPGGASGGASGGGGNFRGELPGGMLVDRGLLSDPAMSRHLRRADTYIRMAAIAAMDAWHHAGPVTADVSMDRVGMIVSSALGPHQRGFRFLDGVLDHGDAAALPTDFSHSVHGASCATIAGMLDLRGPTFSLTDFRAAFAQAVLLAQCWLEQGLCDRVLVGNVEELGPVLMRTVHRVLPAGASYLASEGAVFLLLGKADEPRGALAYLDAVTLPDEVDLLIADHGVFPPRADHPAPVQAARHTNFVPAMGHNAGVLAHQTLGGLLAMREPTLPLLTGDPSSWTTHQAGEVHTALTYVSSADNAIAHLCLTAPSRVARRPGVSGISSAS